MGLPRVVVSNTVGKRGWLREGTGWYPGWIVGGEGLIGVPAPPDGVIGIVLKVSIGVSTGFAYCPCLSQSRVGSVPEM
jgi:hypothetical protein